MARTVNKGNMPDDWKVTISLKINQNHMQTIDFFFFFKYF
jgi:hypothetical protein